MSTWSKQDIKKKAVWFWCWCLKFFFNQNVSVVCLSEVAGGSALVNGEKWPSKESSDVSTQKAER